MQQRTKYPAGGQDTEMPGLTFPIMQLDRDTPYPVEMSFFKLDILCPFPTN